MGSDPRGGPAVRRHVRERKSHSAKQLRSTHWIRIPARNQWPLGRAWLRGHLLRSRRYQQNGSRRARRIALRGYHNATTRHCQPAESVSGPAVEVTAALVRLTGRAAFAECGSGWLELRQAVLRPCSNTPDPPIQLGFPV